MIKECKYCGIKFESNGKRKYHSPRCKKQYENSLRSAPELRGEQGALWSPSEMICKPAWLKGAGAELWDRVGPELIGKGYLNVLSQDPFAELCDLYSKVVEINMAIHEATAAAVASSSNAPKPAAGLYRFVAGRGTKESALSEIKRQYTKQLLEYFKAFGMTPKSNPRNFQPSDGEGQQEKTDGIFDA